MIVVEINCLISMKKMVFFMLILGVIYVIDRI